MLCVCVAKILLFACLSTLIENMRFYDEFVKILQSTPPPSPTFSAELKFAFCGAKLGYGKYACVKDLTNIMPDKLTFEMTMHAQMLIVVGY